MNLHYLWRRGFFSCWALTMMGLIGYLSFLHNSPLHAYQPPHSPASVVASKWNVLHILLADCPCSANVAVYLENRRPSVLAHEEVIVIGSNPALIQSLRKSGWPVVPLSAKQAEIQLGSVGAPWLLIYNPAGTLAYSGGYLGRAIHSPSEPFQDLNILTTLQTGHSLKPLAAFGCVASREFQRRLDPLGLKYTTQN